MNIETEEECLLPTVVPTVLLPAIKRAVNAFLQLFFGNPCFSSTKTN
jgi:hypothetical protein